ncbi:MAG: S-layer homology domain-containing protein [Bacillota bacterium]|nr:S-layer homology domain-containing protein [Bacillota bacterium]
MKNRFLSILLVLCMVVSLLPMSLISAEAAETASTDMNALEALGIDTGEAPEGYDENDKSNPYGKDTVTLNPVGEFYTLGLSQITASSENMPSRNDSRETEVVKIIDNQSLKGTLYGNEKWDIDTAAEMMTDSNADEYIITTGSSIVVGTYKASNVVEDAPSALERIDVSTTVGGINVALTAVASGNFDGNEDGKKSQAAMIYTTKLDKNGGIYLKTGDIIDGYGSESKTLLSTSANIGNPAAELDGNIIEKFDTDPYLMQNYLQVTTGDYDGDGKDEIAVYIPEYGKSRIEVYKLRDITGTDDYKLPGQWMLAWTYSLKETTYVSNMVSMTSGDFNSDGVDDIAATWGYYYGPNDNKGSTAVVLFGSSSDGKMLQNSQEFPLTYGTSGIVRGAFTFGDITGGGQKTLILGGQLNEDLAAKNLNSRFVAFYTWNGESFVQTQASNFDLFAKDEDKEFIYAFMERSPEIFYSSPLCVTNLDVIGQGLGKNAKLYIDSLLFSYSENGLQLEASLDNSNMQENLENPVSYVEYGAVATDLIGFGKETFMTMRQTFSVVDPVEIVETSVEVSYYYKTWFHEIFDLRTWYLSETVTSEDVNLCYNPGETHQIVMDVSENYSSSKKVDVSQSFCVANADEDTTYLNYKGKYFVYSDPEILAVLASPPYYSDLLNRDDLSGNYAESTTSYSTTEGGGSGFTANATISVGTYVSFERDINIMGVSIGKIESETTFKSSFTYEYEESSIMEQTISYSATAGEDMIAFYSIPLEVFEFNASVPDGMGGYEDQIMTVNIPHEAAVRLLSLDEYESIAADYDVLPQIADNVLKHTLGEPGSYPTSSNGYFLMVEYDGDPAAVGYSSSDGGASISQEIAMSSENSSSYSASLEVEKKYGGTVGSVGGGFTVGAEGGAGTVTIDTSGNSFSGEIQNMPIEAQEYSYAYNWRIFSYIYYDGTTSFPVVNYIVSNVIAPPSLPEDFEQNVSQTTDNSVVLTWSYDKTVAGFQIYRYYEFPEGSGSYEIAFVSASSGVQGEDGRYYYSFTDENLAPYTDYGYQIQTVRAAVPNNSIKSEVLTARTKTLNGYPEIQLVGDGLKDGILPIYPDTTSTVTVTVANENDYPEGLSYQWQMLTSSGWSNMNGQTKSTLTFTSSGSADQGEYRCRINVIYYDEDQGNTYYISAFSNTFYADYSKRTAVVEENGFSAVSENDEINLSLSLISGHINHNTAPTGVVTFIINGVDYYATITGELISDGTNSEGKSISTAVANINNLNDGVYEITAIYNGSRVFKSLTILESKTTLVGNSAGYQLNLERQGNIFTKFTYGSEITPVLNEVTIEGNVVIISPITDDVTYSIINSEEIIVKESMIGTFNTPDVGSYKLVAKIGDVEVASRDFNVSPKDITIKIEDKTIGGGNVEGNEPLIGLDVNSQMAFDESLDELGLIYIARNTADNVVELNNETSPGNYIVTPTPGETSELGNYDIIYISGVYTITAQTYVVTYGAEKYQNTLAGTIELTNEGTKFSASVDLLFAANPYNGFEIDKWKIIPIDDNGLRTTDESRWTIQDGKSTLYYEMKDEPIHAVVTFKKAELILSTFTQGGSGTIILPEFFTSGSVVTEGAEMTFTAVPDEGYHFVKWEKIENNVTSQLIGQQNEDGSNTLTLTMGSNSTRLYAYFERDSYTLNLGENLRASYFYDHDGLSTTPDEEKVVTSGANIIGDTEITVYPKTGYTVVEDSEWMQIGSETGTASIDNQSYVFIITGDTEILAAIQREKYSINVSSENGSTVVTLDGNTATPEDLEVIEGGTRVTVTATPNYGYEFDYWEINGEISNQTDSTFIESELGEGLNIVAHFKELDNHTVLVKLDNPLRAYFNYTVADKLGRIQFEDVKVEEPTAGGDIINLFAGDTLTINVVPAPNFMVGKWIIDDTVIDSRQKSYTLEDIQDDLFVQIDIMAQSSHIVNFNDKISRATTDGVEFNSGDYVGGGTTLVFYADSGHEEMVKQWTRNGDIVLNHYDEALVTETYTIDGLSEQVDVDVAFEGKLFRVYDIHSVNTNIEMSFYPMLDGQIRNGAAGIFEISPLAGYRLDKSVIEDLGIFDTISEQDESGKYKCVIKSIEEDIVFNLESEKLYAVNIESTKGGEVKVTGNTAVAGESIAIRAIPDSRYKFEELEVSYLNDELDKTKITVTEGVFTMPAADVTIKATFTYEGGGGSSGGGTISTPTETFKITVSAGIGGVISPESREIEKNESITFKILPEDGYIIEDVKINGKSVGALSSYTFNNVTENMSISATFKEGTLLPDIEKWENTFEDVSNDNWYYEPVGFVTEMGLFKGTNDGEFSPNATMTRAMLVTVLYRFHGNQESLTGKFEDVDPNQWYADGVMWAASSGIVDGYGNNTFGPNNKITREQIAVILYRYGSMIGYDMSSSAEISGFKDGDEISNYAVDSIKWAIGEGLINGKSSDILDPTGEATRAEVAAILMRFIIKLSK